MNEKASSLLTAHSSLDTPHSSLLTPHRILVTGGCGFIGLNLIKFLIHKGYQNLRILDNLSMGTKESLESLLSEFGPFTKNETKNQVNYSLDSSVCPIKSGGHLTGVLSSPREIHANEKQSGFHRGPNHVELVIGDIRNREDCMKATEGIDAVVHLAAHAGVIPSIGDPFFDFDTNALGTLNLLHAAVNNKVDSFIFASSNAPLGNQTPPLCEGKIPKPLSPYGASKLSCEGYCSAFYGSYGLKTVILRFSNVYGPYCLHKQSVIAKFIKDGILKGQLTVYGDGTQTRDFIHVTDLSHAIHLCFSALKEEQLTNQPITNNRKISGEIFHLGTGRETSILDLTKLIKELFHNEIKISFAPERRGEIKRNYSDITKAAKSLSFSPQISLKAGIESVYEWFMNKDIDEIREASILSGSE